MYFLTVSKMWFVKWLWRDLYFKCLVITPFFSCDHQILCVSQLQKPGRGARTGMHSLLSEGIPSQGHLKGKMCLLPWGITQEWVAFSGFALSVGSGTPMSANVLFSFPLFLLQQKTSKASRYDVQLSTEWSGGWGRGLLCNWDQLGPHSECPASPGCKVRPYLNRQRNEAKHHTAFERF